MDKGMEKLFRVAGAIVAMFGALIIWRGVTKMIPITGIVHGGLFTLGGVVFLLAGLGFLLGPWISARRKAAKEKKERSAL